MARLFRSLPLYCSALSFTPALHGQVHNAFKCTRIESGELKPARGFQVDVIMTQNGQFGFIFLFLSPVARLQVARQSWIMQIQMPSHRYKKKIKMQTFTADTQMTKVQIKTMVNEIQWINWVLNKQTYYCFLLNKIMKNNTYILVHYVLYHFQIHTFLF